MLLYGERREAPCTPSLRYAILCTLTRGRWGGGAVLAGTLVYRQDPDLVGQNVGPGLLGHYPQLGYCALLALFGR